MFGYIKTDIPQMRVAEYEAYKSAYCGFCKQLGKDYGFFWRLGLSYDFAFLKVLSEALSPEKVTACKKRCVAHPFHKRYCMGSHAQRRDKMLSAAAVLLADAQMADQIEDGKGISRLFWRLVRLFCRHSVKKAAKDFPEILAITAPLPEKQRQAEQNPSVSADMAADPTGQMMASLLSLLVSKEDAANRRILTEMGYQLGRYVYFTDALDDLKKDAKKGAFNPFLLQRQNFCWETDGEEVSKAALQTINRCIGGAIDAYALLELHHLRPILDNIFYFGLQQTAKRLVSNRKQESKEMEIN